MVENGDGVTNIVQIKWKNLVSNKYNFFSDYEREKVKHWHAYCDQNKMLEKEIRFAKRSVRMNCFHLFTVLVIIGLDICGFDDLLTRKRGNVDHQGNVHNCILI